MGKHSGLRNGISMSIAIMVAMCLALLSACGSPSGNSGDAEAPADPANVEQAGDGLVILYEEDDSLINNYSLLAVNPDAPFVDLDGNPVDGVAINSVGAQAFIDWMLSDEGIGIAENYGIDEYGEALFRIKDDAPRFTGEIPRATPETSVVRLSTTTSVNDSGLLEALIPVFEEEYGYTVEVYSAGTGKAIANAENGNADVILVHSKSQEQEFVDAGYSHVLDGFDSERLTYMYNYFVLCGPADDPAGVKDAASAKDAFAMIADTGSTFISRGDKSGTHTKEVSLWPEDLGITTEADSVAAYTDWYVYSNAGMGDCLMMAREQGGYILSDKATFLAFTNNLNS